MIGTGTMNLRSGGLGISVPQDVPEVESLPGAGARPDPADQPRADLRDIVRAVLAECEPGTTLDQLREMRYDRAFALLRRKIVCRATLAGYRRGEIARFLGLSNSLISKIARTVEDRPPTEYGPRRPRRREQG